MKSVFWLALFLYVAFYVMKEVLPYFGLSSTQISDKHAAHMPRILSHIIGGSIVLILGPLQFWKSLRDRYRSVHRWMGRLYLSGIVVGGVAGVLVSTTAGGGLAGRVGLGTASVAWLVTAFMAFSAIRGGNVGEHREWMIRSYVLAIGFITFRLVFPHIRALGYDSKEVFGMLAWANWAIPLLMTELMLSVARQRKRSRARTARATRLASPSTQLQEQ